MNQTANSSQTERLVHFLREDGSRIPYEVYSSPQVYQLEQERIFRGPIWSFVAMEAEIPHPNDFKSTFVGDTRWSLRATETGFCRPGSIAALIAAQWSAVRATVTLGASPAHTTSGPTTAAAIFAVCRSATDLRG